MIYKYILVIIILTFLLGGSLYKNSNLINQLNQVQDSLRIIETKYKFTEPQNLSDYRLRELVLPKLFKSNEYLECHYITLSRKHDDLFFQFVFNYDSTLIYKYFKIKSDFGVINDTLNRMLNEKTDTLSKSVWIKFRQKLDSLSFYDGTSLDVGCWDQTITWEAFIKGKRHEHRRRCTYGGTRFSNAIEYLISKIKGRDFEVYIDYDSTIFE